MSYSWDYDNSIEGELIRQLLTKADIPEADRHEPLAQIPDVRPGFAVWRAANAHMDFLHAKVVFAGEGPDRDRIKAKAMDALKAAGWAVREIDHEPAFEAMPPEAVQNAYNKADVAHTDAQRLLERFYRAAGCQTPRSTRYDLGRCMPVHDERRPFAPWDEEGEVDPWATTGAVTGAEASARDRLADRQREAWGVTRSGELLDLTDEAHAAYEAGERWTEPPL